MVIMIVFTYVSKQKKTPIRLIIFRIVLIVLKEQIKSRVIKVIPSSPIL